MPLTFKSEKDEILEVWNDVHVSPAFEFEEVGRLYKDESGTEYVFHPTGAEHSFRLKTLIRVAAKMAELESK